jgi:hypothetical protein
MGPIGIVGAGSVAQALGHLLSRQGQPIVALADRTTERAEQAAAFIGPNVQVVELADLPGRSRRILIAVADQGITEVAVALAPGLSGVTTRWCCIRRAPLGPTRWHRCTPSESRAACCTRCRPSRLPNRVFSASSGSRLAWPAHGSRSVLAPAVACSCGRGVER